MGILVATTILTSGVGSQIVSANSKAVSNHQVTADQHHQAKVITRTIRFQRPDNGQSTEVKQVVRYQADGQAITMTEWPEYYLPQFAGYYPDILYLPAKVISSTDESQTIEVEYRVERLRPAMEKQALTNYFEFYDVSGKLVGKLKDKQLYYQQAALPQPPAGYEYVNQDTLPSQYRVYFDIAENYCLLVQPIQPKQTTIESKQVVRQITCHLPTSDQIIEQPITLTRQVTVTSPELNKRVTTPWQVKAESIRLPQVYGYQAATLPDLPSELKDSQEILPVEINYQPDNNAIDEGTQVNIQSESQDSQTQTNNETADQSTMTENESHDESTSTADLATTVDVQTQSETNSTVTTGTDTADLITQRDEGIQQDLSGVDTGSGDASVTVNDESGQTSSTMVDQASGEDSINSSADVTTQTEVSAMTGESGTDTTDLTATVDQGIQTENQGVDTANGDGEIELTDQGSQTSVSQQDATTQIIGSTTDRAVGDDIGNQQLVDGQTQTILPAYQDAASQTADQQIDTADKPADDLATLKSSGPNSTKATPTTDDNEENYHARVNNATPTASNHSIASSDLHERLINLRKSLYDVENESPVSQHANKLLPQTGNQADIKLTLLGVLVTAGIACLSLFGLSKVITKKK